MVATGKLVLGEQTSVKNDPVMTIDALSAYPMVAKSTLNNLAQEGKLPRQNVRRHWRFHKEAVHAWLMTTTEDR